MAHRPGAGVWQSYRIVPCRVVSSPCVCVGGRMVKSYEAMIGGIRLALHMNVATTNEES